jgi:bisphosphoglycerate-independent phosphoglycerate mutase (AlkP superfamily)
MDRYDFVLIEYFLTDLIGHAQDMQNAQIILKSLEAFIESVLSSIPLKETTLTLVSDHGNFEDLSTKSHTRNPTLFMTWGKCAEELNKRCKTIQDPYHVILEIADR